MTEFLDLLNDLGGEVTSARETFSSREDGTRVSATRDIVRGRRNPLVYKQRLAEAIKLVADVVEGRRSPYFLQEVMTTDDFPTYFGDIIDRTMLAKYQNWPVTWTSYARRILVNDFREARVTPPMVGADSILDEVPEASQYPDAALSEQAPFTWRVKKYGRRVPFSWETIINDNLNQLQDIPERLAVAARRTEQRLVTNLFVGLSGPNTDLYNVANENIITTANGSLNGDNPPLTINGLQSAYAVLSKMLDESGEPILRDMMTLVVPPALEVTAMNILNSIEIFDSSILGGGQPDNGSTSGERVLRVQNWMRNRLRLVVDPYIPVLASTANGDRSWFLFADPNTSREAIRIGFLRGHESPEIWMKSPNAVRVGGGDVGPMSGDFDTDSIEYRVRHVTGVIMVDHKATVMSNGSGS
jgi:hypothetical protein